jgi:protocatechuate 3,4-dioxygenase alpha subunit
VKPDLTPSQTVGPFYGFALPYANEHRLVPADSTEVLRVEGQVLDGAGEPVSDALVELWHGGLFGRCGTDPEGAFHFLVAKPSAGRGEAPHLNVTVFARGLLRHLSTRLYFPDEAEANTADPVLALVPDQRRETLIARDEGGVLRFDIRLQGDGETAFFAV